MPALCRSFASCHTAAMPFTPAHAVAALPFRKCLLPFSPLVIGTLSPDFEFFLRLAPRGTFGHTIPGVFALDLPLSLLALWIYEKTVRPAIEASAPGLFPDGRRHPFAIPRTVRDTLLLTASVVLGTFSHIAWDSLTHPGYWPYAHCAVLRAVWQIPGLPRVRTCTLLQGTSTVVGMGILWLLWRRRICLWPGQAPRIKPLGWWLLASAFVMALARAIAGQPLHRKYMHSGLFASEIVITFCSALMLELTFIGLVDWRLQERQRL